MPPSRDTMDARHERFSHAGWEFRTSSGPISGVHQLLALSRVLADPYPGDGQPLPFCVHGATRSLKPCTCGSALVMGVRMHLPEAVFGNNLIEVTHAASGATVSFRVEDALLSWARDSIEHGSRSVKVPPARLPQWEERMKTARRASSVDVDWTFCCSDYNGESRNAPPAGAASGVAAGTAAPKSTSAPRVVNQMGLISTKGPAAASTGAAATTPAPPPPPPPQWSPCSGAAMEPTGYAGRLLRMREPILWSADLPLYEDWLHDHGVSQLRVRVRVMPSCFFVLLRHHLVIDGVIVQQRETRLFHKFGEGHLLRTHRLAVAPVPAAGSGPARRRVFDENEAAQLLAEVNAQEEAYELRFAPAVVAAAATAFAPTAITATAAVVTNGAASGAPAPAADATNGAEAAPAASPADGAAVSTAAAVNGPAAAATVVKRLEPLVLNVPALSAGVAAAAVSADGRFLAVGLHDGGVVLLQLPLQAMADGTTGEPDASSADGGGGGVRWWRSGTPHAGAVCSVAFLEDPAAAADVDAATVAATAPPPRVVSSGEDGRVSLWAVPSADSAAASLDARPLVEVATWRLDCRTADRVYCGEGKARESTAMVQLLAVEPAGVASADGGARFAAAVGATVALLAGNRPDEPTHRLTAHAVVTALAYAPTLRQLCASGNGGVSIWAEWGRGAPLANLRFKGPIDSMAIAPGERYVASGAQDATLVVWPLADVGEAPPDLASLARIDVALAAAAGAKGAIDTESESTAALCGGATLFFGGFEHKVGPVAWHPSGRWCGAAGGRTPVLWDLGDAGDAPPVRQNGRATTLERQTATVAWLGFSDQGLLATAATNGQLLLYDVSGTQGEATGRASVQSPTAICDDAAGNDVLVWGSGAGAGWLFALSEGCLQAWPAAGA